MEIAIAIVGIMIGALVGLGILFGFLALFAYILARLVRTFSDQRISIWWGMLVTLLAGVITSAINYPLFFLLEGQAMFESAEIHELKFWTDLLRDQAVSMPGAMVGITASLMILAKTNLKESALIGFLYLLIGTGINLVLLGGMAGLFVLLISA